jgi:hypothetical protein
MLKMLARARGKSLVSFSKARFLVPPTRQHFVAGLWQTSHFGRFRCACS